MTDHTTDDDCDVGPDGCCTECGVSHGAPCLECECRAFHAEGCHQSDATVCDPGDRCDRCQRDEAAERAEYRLDCREDA